VVRVVCFTGEALTVSRMTDETLSVSTLAGEALTTGCRQVS
jgi:hypothetical protein